MKNCWKNRYIIIGFSLVLAIVVFFTFGTLALASINTIALIAISAFVLISMLIASAIADHSKEFKEAYCCCGSLITIGAGGILLFSILTSISILSELLFSIGIAIIIFFLGLLVGGFWCFLRAYNRCNENDCHCRPYRFTRYDRDTDTWK